MFNNAIIFPISDDNEFPSDVQLMLQENQLRDIQPAEAVTKGWMKPVQGDDYSFTVGHMEFLKLGVTEKLLPASVVNERVEKIIEEKYTRFDKTISRKQKTELRAQTQLDMLPDALSKTRPVLCCIDHQNGLFIVDATSNNKAEEVVSYLRQTLGSFKVSAIGPSTLASQRMTSWLNDTQLPNEYRFGDQVTLSSMDETKSVIKANNISLDSDHMQEHLDNGFMVTEMRLKSNDRVEFNINQSLAFKKIKLMGEAQTDLDDDIQNIDDGDPDKSFIASVSLRISEIVQSWVPIQRLLSEGGAQ